jgi:hypothetical protein
MSNKLACTIFSTLPEKAAGRDRQLRDREPAGRACDRQLRGCHLPCLARKPVPPDTQASISNGTQTRSL